ncbi:MAG: Abi family protein [Bacilli bacterium]|nr:Abi family protein [Bacilli bacterium]
MTANTEENYKEVNEGLQNSNNIEYKVYKTVNEQVEYFKKNKKIIVKDECRAFLFERNYTSVINPYKEFFAVGKDKHNNHIYKEETAFLNIMKLVKIDDDFSHVLYSYISVFERKFKNILITEMCNKYMSNPIDKECITYIDEIKKFIETKTEKNLPRFCPTLYYQLTKDNKVVIDSYGIDSKIELLQHILDIGSLSSDDRNLKKSNKLIKHYLERQKKLHFG